MRGGCRPWIREGPVTWGVAPGSGKALLPGVWRGPAAWLASHVSRPLPRCLGLVWGE